MSLVSSATGDHLDSFPRVSGDEPPDDAVEEPCPPFSPRERG